MPDPPEDIFRREALEHSRRPRERADLLQRPPAWTGLAYWLLLAAVIAGAAYLATSERARELLGPLFSSHGA